AGLACDQISRAVSALFGSGVGTRMGGPKFCTVLRPQGNYAKDPCALRASWLRQNPAKPRANVTALILRCPGAVSQFFGMRSRGENDPCPICKWGSMAGEGRQLAFRRLTDKGYVYRPGHRLLEDLHTLRFLRVGMTRPKWRARAPFVSPTKGCP